MKAKSTILGLAAVVAALVSCQKETLEQVITDNEVKLTVNSNEWLPEETRSQNTPGTGIALSGSENITLYYKAGASLSSSKVIATGSAGQYTFTIPAAAEGATWYPVIPYTTTYFGQTSGDIDRVFARLGPVQFPGADTFDPASDILVGEPFTVSEGSATINMVKRLTAPLRLLISGLDEGEKIYTCTMALSTAAAGISTALQGQLFIKLSSDCDVATFYGASGQSVGSAITAEYANGLSAIDGSWPVWFSVNPITMKSGADLTVTVTTATRTITRTVSLPANGILSATKINKISINMAGAGASSRESVCQDFTAQTISGSSLSLKASNGDTYVWPVSSASLYSSSTDALANALKYSAAGSFTFPSISGKKITSARVYAHPASGASTSAATTLTIGSKTYNFSLNATDKTDTPTYKGGYVDIELPEGVEDLGGQTVTVTASASGIAVISAITLFTADSGSVTPDANDYYDQFNAGQDITIGDMTFNKSNTTARLVKLYEGDPGPEILKDYTENGILFLDYDEADGKADEISYGMISPENCVIIGRYKNHQPTITFTSFLSQKESIYMKNVKLVSTGTSAVINSWKLTQNAEAEFEDCTIISGGSGIKEQNATYYFTKLILSNCVISLAANQPVYTINRSGIMSQPDFKKLSIENCVIYAAGGASSSTPVVKLYNLATAYVETPNLDLEFNHNSIYNINYGYNGLIRVYTLGNINFLSNAGVAEMTAGTSAVLLSYQGGVSTVTGTALNGNYFAESSASGGKWVYWNTAISAIARKFDDKLNVTVSPFASTDATNGYFPVDESVTSAGASYLTKSWRNWGE